MAWLQNDSLNKHWSNGSSGRVQVCFAHQLPGFLWIIHILVFHFRKQKMVNPELEDFVCSQGVTKVQLQIWAQHGKMQKMQGREWLSATQMFRYEACVIALFL